MKTRSTTTRPTSPELEKVEAVPHVLIVIKSPDGTERGATGGTCRALATTLEQVVMLEDSPLTKRDSLFVGQDFFDADREFLLSVLGCCTFLSKPERQTLCRDLLEDSRITFIVSY